MKYKVIKAFADLQDCNHSYFPGDEYPRKGYSPTPERIDELLSDKNRIHTPLIKIAMGEDPAEEEPKQEPVKRTKRTKK